MQFFLACLAWVVLAFILGLAIWLGAVKGMLWVLFAAIALFVVIIGKVAYTSH